MVAMKKLIPVALISLIFGSLGAWLTLRMHASMQKPETSVANETLIADHYNSEMATMVSPTTLKRWIDAGEDAYILVDLRSQAEYAREHFKTAINIPAVSLNEAQLVAEFEKLPKDKPVIVHCYSAYCTLGRKVGQTLAKHNIYVQELTVGWSELRYHYDLWNPGANAADGEQYIIKGDPDSIPLPPPCVDGEFGC